MKKGIASNAAAWCLVAIVVVLVAHVHETAAVTCIATELSPCLSAILGTAPEPTPACCGKLKEQVPCFCRYVANPMLKPYIDSPNAKKVAATCGVPPASC